jgi:hypothetical protein
MARRTLKNLTIFVGPVLSMGHGNEEAAHVMLMDGLQNGHWVILQISK